MINFLLDLMSNLVILAALLTICCVINWTRPDAHANGYWVFVVLAAIALVFDAVLTFLVFADSRMRYGQFSTLQAFVPRVAAYVAACGIALGLSRMRSRKAAGRGAAGTVIRPSPSAH